VRLSFRRGMWCRRLEGGHGHLWIVHLPSPAWFILRILPVSHLLFFCAAPVGLRFACGRAPSECSSALSLRSLILLCGQSPLWYTVPRAFRLHAGGGRHTQIDISLVKNEYSTVLAMSEFEHKPHPPNKPICPHQKSHHSQIQTPI
jgi:hypothetical protein